MRDIKYIIQIREAESGFTVDLLSRAEAKKNYIAANEGEVRDTLIKIAEDIYRAIYQRGLGDVIASVATPIARARRRNSPGDIFKRIIKQVTGVSPCGICSDRAQQMNTWGWSGCWKNRNTIGGWLIEEAGKRGHKIGKAKALSLLAAALKEARRQRNAVRPSS